MYLSESAPNLFSFQSPEEREKKTSSAMFADCRMPSEIILQKEEVAQTLSFQHTHTHTHTNTHTHPRRQPNASTDCWSIRYDIYVVSVCGGPVRGAASPTQIESRDLSTCGQFVIPEATGSEGGGVRKPACICVCLCVCVCVCFLHLMSLHANMSFLSGAKKRSDRSQKNTFLFFFRLPAFTSNLYRPWHGNRFH